MCTIESYRREEHPSDSLFHLFQLAGFCRIVSGTSYEFIISLSPAQCSDSESMQLGSGLDKLS